MPKKATWILVADAGRARVLEAAGHGGELTEVDGLDIVNEIPKTSDTVRDSLPRTFDSSGPGRHAIAPKSDPRRSAKRDFAEELAGKLAEAEAKGAFQELVIIAPAQMTGDLRQCLTADVKRRVTREFLLDLAHAPKAEIARRLKETP